MLLANSILLQGCHTLQAVNGQMELVFNREPVAELLADPGTPDALRARLELAQSVRSFAHESLRLPDNGSYRHYVALDRPYVLWNVVVTDEFGLEPRRWCAPVAGCVSYRGWFDQRAAERFAARHRTRGRDVTIGGVPAYSTLGWFDDPLIDTMFRGGEAAFAALLFHELAHQWLYVAGDSAFSEAFAVVVERKAVRLWLSARGADEALAEYGRRQGDQDRRLAALDAARTELSALYALQIPVAEMRARKRSVLTELQAQLGESRPRNNADLAASATYHELVPQLQRLLEEADGDLARFREAARAFAVQRRP